MEEILLAVVAESAPTTVAGDETTSALDKLDSGDAALEAVDDDDSLTMIFYCVFPMFAKNEMYLDRDLPKPILRAHVKKAGTMTTSNSNFPCSFIGFDPSGRVPRDLRLQSLTAQNTLLGCGGSGDTGSTALTVYVAIDGNDATGDGSFGKPYRTVAFAMSTITTATRFDRFVLYVGPGRYNETQTVFIKANVLVQGSGNQFSTRIGANWRLDPTDVAPLQSDIYGWNGSDPRSGFQNLVIAGPTVPVLDPFLIDFSTATFPDRGSLEGKMYFILATANVAPRFIGFSNVNQAIVQSCLEFPGHIQEGLTVVYQGTVVIGGGTLQFESSPTSNTNFAAFGGGSNGSIDVTWNEAHGPVSVELYSFPTAGITTNVVGVGVTPGPFLSVTSDSLPLDPNVTLDPRTVLTLLNDAHSVAYTPTNPAKWPSLGPGIPTPTTVQQALDYLAQALLP